MTETSKTPTAVFRASKEPTTALPIGVRSVGEHVFDARWQEPVKNTHSGQLFWGVGGEGEILLDGTFERIPPRHIAFYRQGDYYEIRRITPVWNFRWVTLDGPLCADIVQAFGLERSPRYAGPCPEKIFTRLEHEILESTPAGQRTAAATAYEILSLACGSAPQAGSAVRTAIDTIHRKFAEPSFNVNELARELGVNRSQLSREFRARIGTTLIESITARRIQHALSLLQETSLSVEEISRRSGFSDPDYFARVVRRTVGVSPTHFRKL